MLGLCFYRDPEEIEEEEQAVAKKAMTKEEFQGEWTAPAPEFTDTVMHLLMMGICPEKCVIRRFRRCANITECTYTNLDIIAYYAP